MSTTAGRGRRLGMALLGAALVAIVLAIWHVRHDGKGPVSHTSSLLDASSPWPAAPNEWRQPDIDAAHSRYMPASIVPPLRVAWKRPLSLDAAPVVAAGNTLYLLGHSSDHDNTYTLTAMRPSDGRVQWTKTYGLVSGDSFNVFATPEGVVLPDEADGRVVYLRAADGAELLTLGHEPSYHFPDDVAQLGGDLVIEDSPWREETYAPYFDRIDLTSGRVRAGRSFVGWPGYDTSDGPYLLGADRWGVFPGPGDWLFLQDASTLATFSDGFGGRLHGLFYTDLNCGGAVVDRDHVYIQISSFGKGYPLLPGDRTYLLALDRHGKQVWRAALPLRERESLSDSDDYAPLVVTPRLVLVPGHLGLCALDKRTGRLVWRAGPTAPVAVGRYGYGIRIGPPKWFRYWRVHEDTLFAFSLRTGRDVWSRPVGQIVGTPFVHRGALYVVQAQVSADYLRNYYLLKLVPKRT